LSSRPKIDHIETQKLMQIDKGLKVEIFSDTAKSGICLEKILPVPCQLYGFIALLVGLLNNSPHRQLAGGLGATPPRVLRVSSI